MVGGKRRMDRTWIVVKHFDGRLEQGIHCNFTALQLRFWAGFSFLKAT